MIDLNRFECWLTGGHDKVWAVWRVGRSEWQRWIPGRDDQPEAPDGVGCERCLSYLYDVRMTHG